MHVPGLEPGFSTMKQKHMHGDLKEYIRENLTYVMISVFIVDINKY